jgi:hypothetical protein
MTFRKGFGKKIESDYSKIRVTSNGAFYMRSADIFNNKEESLTLLSKLSKTLKVYKSKQDKNMTNSKKVVNA